MQINTNDFNKKLMEMLCTDNEEDDKHCLISNVELEENHVNLSCGHKFNYFSIFNEVCSQKIKGNHYETQRLSKNQIKCPYCRTVQNGLLISREGYDNINYVNWPKSLQYKPNKCVYVFLSGKRKNQPCNTSCSSICCPNHAKIIEKRKQKELMKQTKLEEKKKKQQEKEKQKEKKSQNYQEENLIIDLSSQVEVYDFTCEGIGHKIKNVCVTCQYQFKKGKNKGKCCPAKKITNGYCNKHIKYSSQLV